MAKSRWSCQMPSMRRKLRAIALVDGSRPCAGGAWLAALVGRQAASMRWRPQLVEGEGERRRPPPRSCSPGRRGARPSSSRGEAICGDAAADVGEADAAIEGVVGIAEDEEAVGLVAAATRRSGASGAGTKAVRDERIARPGRLPGRQERAALLAQRRPIPASPCARAGAEDTRRASRRIGGERG